MGIAKQSKNRNLNIPRIIWLRNRTVIDTTRKLIKDMYQDGVHYHFIEIIENQCSCNII